MGLNRAPSLYVRMLTADPNNLYIHTLDPFAIQLTESFGIRWYGLAYLTGFLATYYLIQWFSKKGLSSLTNELAGDFVFAAAIGTIIGGRLGYCLLYSPDLFLSFTNTPPFWGVFAINQGGMASHGGILGIFITCILFGRKRNISALHLADLSALGGTIGIFFGRIANFINGELVGRACVSLHAWCVKFPSDILLWPAQEPNRLAGLAPLVLDQGLSNTKWSELMAALPGSSGAWEKVESALQHIILSIQHGNAQLVEAIAPLLTARHPSQLYEAMLEGLLMFILLMPLMLRKARYGMVCAWFFIFYSLVRILGEAFRMPDAQLGFQLWGLTRGQWLSFGLLGFGIVFLIYVRNQHYGEDTQS